MRSLQHPRPALLLLFAVGLAAAEVPAFAQATAPVPAPTERSSARSPDAATSQIDAKLLSQRAAYDAAFKDSLDNPSDPAVLVKFAKIAVTMGDVEGAISALERLLLIEGDQPEVKLELGVLYYRLGAVDAARAYLEQVRDSELATDDMRQRASTYLSSSETKK